MEDGYRRKLLLLSMDRDKLCDPREIPEEQWSNDVSLYPSQMGFILTSIVKSIMQYQLPNPALKWGRDNEDNGIKEYMSHNEQKHSNLKYCSSGLTVSTDYSNPFAPEHSNPYAPTLALCSARWCALKDRSDSGLFFENTNIVGT